MTEEIYKTPPDKPILSGGQIITIILIVANTYLILSGHHELSQDMNNAARLAASNAAQAVAQDCRQAFASTPMPDHQP